MKKIYIKENKLKLLKEENSPDCVFIDDEALTYFDKDAHAFIVMNSKDGFKIAIGEEGSTHPSIRNEIAANYMGFRTYDDFKEYIYENEEYIDDLYGELEMYIDDICNNSLYDGRYWINKEIITFWYKTPSTEKLDLILNEICEKLGVDVSNVRVVVGNHIIPYEEYNYWDDIDNDKFKPKDSKSDKELRAIHLMNQQDKKDALKDFRQNRGEIQGKKLGKMPMAQYHSLIYQENKNKKKVIKEFFYRDNQANADNVIVQDLDLHLWWEDSGAYPFGWFYQYDGDYKLFIGDESSMHSSPCEKALHKYINDKITEDESRADIDGTFNDELNGYSKYSFLEHPDDVSYREETETEDDRNDYYYEPYFDPSNYLISNYISYNHTVNEFDEMLQSMDVSGRFWKYDKVISFWSSMSPSMLDEYIDDLQRQTNIDFSDYMYVYEDYDDENSIKYCTVSEFINSGRDIEFKADERENKGIHLMKPKEKAEALKDFKSIRGEKQGQKLGNMTMAQYHNLIYQEEKDIDTILENFNLEVEPNEVDLSSFEIEKSLNKEIWGENNKLNSKIRLKLLDIADDFFNSLEVNFVKPIDIVLTGSLCNFNWSEFSDIDLHIIVNFDEISEKTEFVKEYFDAKKNEWNNEHKDLKIYDFPIELYVQNSNEYGISNGMYSLESNEWIKEPDINDLEPLDKVSSQKIKRIASNIMTKIDDYFDYFAECSDNHKLELLNNEIDNLLYKLKVYRQKGLERYGESGTPNIVYKVLRRTKYLEDLWDLRTQIYDKLNSIN